MNYSRNFMKLMIVVAAIIITMGACNKKDKEKKKEKVTEKEAVKEEKAAPIDSNGMISIRYINEDSVLNNYKLAKDFQEMATRLENEFDQASKNYANQLGSLQNSISQKMQNNQYANETAYKNDMQRYQQMESNAQKEMAKLQERSANQMEQSQKQLNDSIDNFLKEYAIKNHYDMILKKGAGFYFNPNYDVTDDVIKGLNKRYSKGSN